VEKGVRAVLELDAELELGEILRDFLELAHDADAVLDITHVVVRHFEDKQGSWDRGLHGFWLGGFYKRGIEMQVKGHANLRRTGQSEQVFGADGFRYVSGSLEDSFHSLVRPIAVQHVTRIEGKLDFMTGDKVEGALQGFDFRAFNIDFAKSWRTILGKRRL
jgi:hypothetical protein